MIESIKEMVGLDPISSLSNKSGKIMDVFTSTIKQLTEVNEKAQEEVEAREREIARIAAENEQLIGIKVSNAKVIEKLNKLFV